MTKQTRREFLKSVGLAAGAVALGSLLPIPVIAQEEKKREWVEGYVHLVFEQIGRFRCLENSSQGIYLWNCCDLISVALYPDYFSVQHKFAKAKDEWTYNWPHPKLVEILEPLSWCSSLIQTSIWVPLSLLQSIFLPEAVTRFIDASPGGVAYV